MTPNPSIYFEDPAGPHPYGVCGTRKLTQFFSLRSLRVHLSSATYNSAYKPRHLGRNRVASRCLVRWICDRTSA
jgi:hypothetical protein